MDRGWTACYAAIMPRKADEERMSLDLGALLKPHVGPLGEAARAREQARREQAEREAARAGLRRLDEAELMALIFTHLDPENPRVCEGIDFDRLVILDRPPEPPAAAPEAEPEAEPTLEPELETEDDNPDLDADEWIGRSWTDDIRPIPAAMLDRPQLSSEQRELLVRARRRVSASVNLRHLGRGEALAHLDLHVQLCRERRVRFCRVIPGKGIDSKVEPVLKRAVIEWCRAPERDAVLGWAPELDRHGEWGAMILELRAASR
jgi:DNA-nicking Smr family endonuclease